MQWCFCCLGQFWRLVTRVGVMKEFMLPSLPMLTMSRGLAISPGWLSGIAFIMNEGDAGLGCFPQSRRSVAAATVIAMEAVGGTYGLSVQLQCCLWPTVVHLLIGKAIAMMLSVSLCAASTILSASAGLVIN